MGMSPGEPVTPMPAEKFPAASEPIVGGRRILWPSAAIAGGVLALWGIFSLMPFSDSTRTAEDITWLVAASLSAIGVLLFALYSYRKTLIRLRRGICTAQDGALEPITDIHPRSPFLARLLNDYNRMISTLRSMFFEVEECQNRVLAERNRMNAIIQSLPGALLGIDDELCVNAINKLTEEYFGLPQEELCGRNLFDLLSVGEADREILRDAFLSKQRISNQEIDLSIGGVTRCFSLNLVFLSEQDADLDAVATLQDINDYKQLQESVNSREKLVALGQLAGGVAHELNTPLGNILGYAQLLRDGVHDPDKAERFVRVICEETRRCSRIIDELLSYARKDKCDEESCDLNALAREAVDTFLNCRVKRHNIRLLLEFDPRAPVAAIGSGHIDIVLVNLLLNALHALKGVPDPQIIVKTQLEPKTGTAVLIVADNGPGVPERIRGRIFDPFFTTKEVGEGSGLGLAIGQAILSKRGARIRYDETYADGARFIVRLPAIIASP